MDVPFSCSIALFIVEFHPRCPSPTPWFGRPCARSVSEAADALAGVRSHCFQGRNSTIESANCE